MNEDPNLEVLKMKEVRHVDVKEEMKIDELVKEMREGAGFGARHLAESVDIYEEMIRDEENTIFLTLAGALIPGGMKKVISKLILKNYVDVLISTGAILTHDLIEAFGYKHFHGSAVIDDDELQKRGLNRIYNILLPNEAYIGLEKRLNDIFGTLEIKNMSNRAFLYELGKTIENKDSILKIAADNSVPIYCPAISDSVLGYHIWSYSQLHELPIDIFKEHKEIVDIAFDSPKKGAVICGGGVPKHFVALAMQVTGKGLDYAIQITMDRPEPGGVSGASLKEAISWNKVDSNAKKVDVICDITIALPIILGSLMTRLKSFKRKRKKFEFYG
ncbi:MAG: deoxyhypusine synthase [Candidatus Lokiarchaeota archaeon]|nr:deoxyhypusine synthase [Candidatus Lokiarchaeota archaeon]